jgi:hypothetical protein
MVYILYLVLDFYIFYFILANRLASPYFISVFPFLFGPLFLFGIPFYSVSKDQINFYLSSIRSCSFAAAAAPNASSRHHVFVLVSRRPSIVRTCKMC